GVSLGGAAHGADTGSTCRAFVGGGRCPPELSFRKSHRVNTGVLRRPFVALELIALLLLHRLPFGRVNLRLLSRRRCDKRETDQRDEDHCSLHGYAPDAVRTSGF